MNWFWIAIALTVPSAMGVLVALPFWLKGHATMGSIVGAAVIFAAAIAFIGREYVEIERLNQQCILFGVGCAIDPDTFARVAPYAVISMLEVFGLFTLGLIFDERSRRRGFDREWQ